MADQYEPTEVEIAAVLAKTGSDPRKLAIAYLRSSKRARGAETAFKIMDGLAGMGIGLASGDIGAIDRSADRAMRAGRAAAQAAEEK